MEFKEECQTRGVRLPLAAPEHQEMNGQVEVTWRTLRTVVHALMVHDIHAWSDWFTIFLVLNHDSPYR